MYILQQLGDQTRFLVWGKISNAPFIVNNPFIRDSEIYKTLFFGFVTPAKSIHPILDYISSILLTYFGPGAFAFLNLFFVLMTLIISYRFFKAYKFGLVYSLLFTLSSFMWSHIGLHISLMVYWLFPLFFILLRKVQNGNYKLKYGFLLGIFLAFSLILSPYFGFIILVFSTIYCCVEQAYVWLSKKKLNIAMLKSFLVSYFLALVCTTIVFFPYIKAWVNTAGDIKRFDQGITMERAYEDFFTFSSRPWYFLIPSTRNPVLGNYAESIYSSLNNSNYFLADDYFPAEHSSNYFGSVFLLSLVLVSYTVLKNSEYEIKKNITVSYISVLILILFMMPPYFTISGVKLYTPGQLMYHFAPMFRVTARMSVIVHFLLLYIFALSINFIYKHLEKSKKILKSLMPILLVLTLIETFEPIDIYRVPGAPEVYTYMNQKTPSDSRFIVFPYSKTLEGLFWLDAHEREMVNARGYKNEEYTAQVLTNSLLSVDGQKNIHYFDVDYVVVFKSTPKDQMEKLKALDIRLEFESKEAYLYKVNK